MPFNAISQPEYDVLLILHPCQKEETDNKT